jgi:CHAT domain-containing protein
MAAVAFMVFSAGAWIPLRPQPKAPGLPLGLPDRLVRALSWVSVQVPLAISIGIVVHGSPVNPVLTLAVGALASAVCALSRYRARKMVRRERRSHLLLEMAANVGGLGALTAGGIGRIPTGTWDLLLLAGTLMSVQLMSTKLLRWPVPLAWSFAHPAGVFANGTVLAYVFLFVPSTPSAWASIAVSATALVTVAVHLGTDDWSLWWARVESARRFRTDDPRSAAGWLRDEVREPTGLALPHTMAALAVYDLRGDFRQNRWPPDAHAVTSAKHWLATADHLITTAEPHVGSVAAARAHCTFARGQVLEAAADWTEAVTEYDAAASAYRAAGLPAIAAVVELFRARVLAERLGRAKEAESARAAIARDDELPSPVRRWAGARLDNLADHQIYRDVALRAGLPHLAAGHEPPWLPLVVAAPPGAPAEEHEITRIRWPGTGPAQRMIDQGTRLFRRGEHVKGAVVLRAAATLLEQNSQQITAMGVLAELARLQTPIDPGAAFQTLEEALRLQERFRAEVVDEELRLQINGWFETLHSHQIGLLTAVEMPDWPNAAITAFDLAERSRSRLLLEQLGGTTHLRAEQVPDTLVLRELDALTQVRRERTAMNEPGRRVAGLEAVRSARARLADTWREIAATGAAGAEYAGLRRGDPLTFGDLEPLLGTALLAEYHVTEDAVVLLLAAAGAAEPAVVRVPMRRSALAVAEWQDLSPLVAPLVERSTPGQVIWIVPHDHLHGVPLHAIEVGGVPLAERNPTCYTPSAAVMRYCQAKRRPAENRSLVLADSRADRPLTHSRAQSLLVASILSGAERLVGDQASIGGMRSAVGSGVSVLHIACHGEFDAEQPAQSRVLLANEDGDGALTAEKILGMSLPADLVTLSACQSGVAHRRAGDELFGLPRALIYAGASAVLVSLWPVDEVATGLLMYSFYRARKAGAGKAEALRTAQLAVRASTCAEVIEYCTMVGGDERTLLRNVADVRFRAGDFAAASDAYSALLRSGDDQNLLIAHARAELAALGTAARPDYGRRMYADPLHWAGFVLIGDWR